MVELSPEILYPLIPARTVEDFLARRRRVLFQNARVSVEMAPSVATLMAGELGYDTEWEKTQVKRYTELAGHYLADALFPKGQVSRHIPQTLAPVLPAISSR